MLRSFVLIVFLVEVYLKIDEEKEWWCVMDCVGDDSVLKLVGSISMWLLSR